MLYTSNSYGKRNLACLNISLFKWHYFHHNSSGKVVSGVKQEGKSSFCPEKANPAGDEVSLFSSVPNTPGRSCLENSAAAAALEP